jgi:S-adenosylmethionine:tRNA ribosyltransferase-isomerase
MSRVKTADFSFELPPEYIAQFPSPERAESRLMTLDRMTGARAHDRAAALPRLLEKGTLVVLNNTRVRKVRVAGETARGVRADFLLLEPPPAGSGAADAAVFRAFVRHRKRFKGGTRIFFPGGVTATAEDGADEFLSLRFEPPPGDAWFERFGRIPLPPYIKRKNIAEDDSRYQTVYAEETGSVAAPTAGLHISRALLEEFTARGIETAFVTLHVGAGTFLPVRTEYADEHQMHREYFCIGEEAARRIEAAKRAGRPVLAVGTTALRAMEAAWDGERFTRGWNATSLFIYGDYQFRTADMLFTNFHTPCSTLLMLAASFCGAKTDSRSGLRLLLESYAEAQKKGYRFFSYGDAMLLR